MADTSNCSNYYICVTAGKSGKVIQLGHMTCPYGTMYDASNTLPGIPMYRCVDADETCPHAMIPADQGTLHPKSVHML